MQAGRHDQQRQQAALHEVISCCCTALQLQGSLKASISQMLIQTGRGTVRRCAWSIIRLQDTCTCYVVAHTIASCIKALRLNIATQHTMAMCVWVHCGEHAQGNMVYDEQHTLCLLEVMSTCIFGSQYHHPASEPQKQSNEQ